jgi:hypothetical protein
MTGVAAELLMPESLVRQAVQEHGADAAWLADRFDESAKAMSVRLGHLHLATHDGDPAVRGRDSSPALLRP